MVVLYSETEWFSTGGINGVIFVSITWWYFSQQLNGFQQVVLINGVIFGLGRIEHEVPGHQFERETADTPDVDFGVEVGLVDQLNCAVLSEKDKKRS